MLFGRKKPEEKTFLLLDIETGSVGGALVRISATEAPRLVGEHRVEFAPAPVRDTNRLRTQVAEALRTVAEGLSHIAARLRAHPHSTPLGEVSRAAVFMGAPWGVPNLVEGKPYFDEQLGSAAHLAVADYFAVPTQLHARASALLAGARLMLPYEEGYLLILPGAELTELLSVVGGSVHSYGTLPAGAHTLLRTLGSHAGLSHAEARSALRLEPAHLQETLRAAREHVAEMFAVLASEQGWHTHERLYTFGNSAWFARALVENSTAALFPQGSLIKHLQAEHLSPHFLQHAAVPDQGIMHGALFVDSHYQ